MLNTESLDKEQTPVVNPGNYSPVTVHMSETVGVVFLGILSIVLLIGWRRAETRYRNLIAQQAGLAEKHL